ncbi:MAG TPA: glycosyltransferase, partial [Actinomycetota bacterium]|nr:glycosyltransferase [Actinomycetota bacterium]
ACGTPVVAAAVGGLRTVVRGGGLLVEGHDAADHADAVRAVLGDPALSERLGTTGARESLAFTWDATTTEVRSIYRELVEAGA